MLNAFLLLEKLFFNENVLKIKRNVVQFRLHKKLTGNRYTFSEITTHSKKYRKVLQALPKFRLQLTKLRHVMQIFQKKY